MSVLTTLTTGLPAGKRELEYVPMAYMVECFAQHYRLKTKLRLMKAASTCARALFWVGPWSVHVRFFVHDRFLSLPLRRQAWDAGDGCSSWCCGPS